MNGEHKLAGFEALITTGYTLLICVGRPEKLTKMIPGGHGHPCRIKHSKLGSSQGHLGFVSIWT